MTSRSFVSLVGAGSLNTTSRLLVRSAPAMTTRSLWVMGKDAESKTFVDPNAPTTYKVKHIYSMDRIVKGRPGVRRLRYNGYVPASITGGGLPIRNIVVEWGRIYGLLQTKNFYKDRKYILNISDTEKIVVRLAHATTHAVNEKALFLKFVRTGDDPHTVTEEPLPFLVHQEKIKKEKHEIFLKKKAVQDLMKIDLTFKPAVKRADLKL
eukprot:gene14346-16927_t